MISIVKVDAVQIESNSLDELQEFQCRCIIPPAAGDIVGAVDFIPGDAHGPECVEELFSVHAAEVECSGLDFIPVHLKPDINVRPAADPV